DGFSGNAGFLPVVLRNERGAILARFMALHFGRSSVAAGNRASLLRKIRTRDPLLLRRIGVWRDLLCPRSTAGSGICWRGDVWSRDRTDRSRRAGVAHSGAKSSGGCWLLSRAG